MGSAWRTGSLLSGVVAGALAVAYVTGPDGLVNTLLVLGGVVALPAWLLLTRRALRDGPKTR
jgi:hypothetical protein